MQKGFLSAVHFFLVLAFSLASLFFFQLSYNSWLKASFFSFLEKPNVFFYLGILGSVCSFILFIGFYFFHRKSFYQVKMEKGTFKVEEGLVTEIVQKFLLKKMPTPPCQVEVAFHSNKKMEITLYCMSVFQDAFYLNFQKVKKELREELKDQLGYDEKCLITVISI